MNDKFNTIAGWVLGGGIVLLGGMLVAGEVFKEPHHESKAYPIDGVVDEHGKGGATAEPPIAALLATADAGRGANAFKKCTACHTITQGGPTGVGPNLWGVMGAPHGHVAGFSYSDALKAHAGPWNFEEMNQWLRRPSAYAPGTKMSFPGLSDPQERADLILYLNSQGSNLPLPPVPAAGEAPAAEGGNSAAPTANAAAPAGNAAAPATGANASAPADAGAHKGGGDAHPQGTNPAGGH